MLPFTTHNKQAAVSTLKDSGPDRPLVPSDPAHLTIENQTFDIVLFFACVSHLHIISRQGRFYKRRFINRPVSSLLILLGCEAWLNHQVKPLLTHWMVSQRQHRQVLLLPLQHTVHQHDIYSTRRQPNVLQETPPAPSALPISSICAA